MQLGWQGEQGLKLAAFLRRCVREGELFQQEYSNGLGSHGLVRAHSLKDHGGFLGDRAVILLKMRQEAGKEKAVGTSTVLKTNRLNTRGDRQKQTGIWKRWMSQDTATRK